MLAEPIQTVMRRYGIKKPYEKLKEADSGGKRVDAEGMKQFIDGLALPEEEKARLKAMTPANYIGRAITMVDELNKCISAGWRCCPACLLKLSTFSFFTLPPLPAGLFNVYPQNT